MTMPDKTLRLDLDLYEQAAKVAEREDRPTRKQIERWIREALEKMPKSRRNDNDIPSRPTPPERDSNPAI